jgi:hypothetical protein
MPQASFFALGVVGFALDVAGVFLLSPSIRHRFMHWTSGERRGMRREGRKDGI